MSTDTAATPLPVPPPTATPTAVEKIKFECCHCKFKIMRLPKDLQNDCPKCNGSKPYVAPSANGSATTSRVTTPVKKPTLQSTIAANKTPIISSPSGLKKITFNCRHCDFKLTREEKDKNNDCAKCCQKSPHSVVIGRHAATNASTHTPIKKPTLQDTIAANKTPLLSSPSGQKITFECQFCKFRISRLEKDKDHDCPKCNRPKPYLSPEEAKKKAEIKTLTTASAKTTGTSTKPCPKRTDGGFHEYSLGTCKHCHIAQGKLEDRAATASPSGVTSGSTKVLTGPDACPKNGNAKHIFTFSKCKFCGVSELEITKQKKAVTPGTGTPKK